VGNEALTIVGYPPNYQSVYPQQVNGTLTRGLLTSAAVRGDSNLIVTRSSTDNFNCTADAVIVRRLLERDLGLTRVTRGASSYTSSRSLRSSTNAAFVQKCMDVHRELRIFCYPSVAGLPVLSDDRKLRQLFADAPKMTSASLCSFLEVAVHESFPSMIDIE